MTSAFEASDAVAAVAGDIDALHRLSAAEGYVVRGWQRTTGTFLAVELAAVQRVVEQLIAGSITAQEAHASAALGFSGSFVSQSVRTPRLEDLSGAVDGSLADDELRSMLAKLQTASASP